MIHSLRNVTGILLLWVLMGIGCSKPGIVPLVSPSGTFMATTEISGKEAGPTRRSCVRLKITDTQTKQEITFLTSASDRQKWALAWTPEGSLLLYSSDIGIYAYEIREGQILERSANSAEQEVARCAYQRKYGRSPPT